MVDGLSAIDEFLGPTDRLELVEPETNEMGIEGDGGGAVEFIVIGRPPERGAQVR